MLLEDSYLNLKQLFMIGCSEQIQYIHMLGAKYVTFIRKAFWCIQSTLLKYKIIFRQSSLAFKIPSYAIKVDVPPRG